MPRSRLTARAETTVDLVGLWVKLVRAYYEEKGVRSRVIPKQVVCENCHALYVYRMRRSAGAVGFHAAWKVGYLAKKALRRKLERDCDLVPCPACGSYQQGMIEKARKAARREMPVLSVVLTLASAPLFILALYVWDHGPNPTHDRQSMIIAIAIGITGGLCLLIGLGLGVAKYIGASRLDLNATSRKERLRIGQARARIIAEEDKREP